MATPARGAAEGQLGSLGFLGLSQQGALNCPHRRWDLRGLCSQGKGGRELGQGQARKLLPGHVAVPPGFAGGRQSPVITGASLALQRLHCFLTRLPCRVSPEGYRQDSPGAGRPLEAPCEGCRLREGPNQLSCRLHWEHGWRSYHSDLGCRTATVVPAQDTREWAPAALHSGVSTALLLPHSQYTQGLWGTPASSQLGALASSPHFFPRAFEEQEAPSEEAAGMQTMVSSGGKAIAQPSLGSGSE